MWAILYDKLFSVNVRKHLNNQLKLFVNLPNSTQAVANCFILQRKKCHPFVVVYKQNNSRSALYTARPCIDLQRFLYSDDGRVSYKCRWMMLNRELGSDHINTEYWLQFLLSFDWTPVQTFQLPKFNNKVLTNNLAQIIGLISVRQRQSVHVKMLITRT